MAKKTKFGKPGKKRPQATTHGNTKTQSAHRRALFVDAMMRLDGNQTQSAIAAGYSKKTAHAQGCRLLKYADVREALEKRRAALLTKFELSTEAVLREVARICYFDPAKCLDADGKPLSLQKIDEDTRRAISTVKDGEVQAFNKNQALRNAMQYLNLIGPKISVHANAKSVAAAEASMVEPEKRSMLDVARRIAFTLSMGAEIASATRPAPEKTAPHKQPA